MKQLTGIGFLFLCLIALSKQTIHAQDTASVSKVIVKKDTLKKDTAQHKLSFSQRVNKAVFVDHSPKAAGIMSAVIPGLGQAYNRKYWKMPIVYGGSILITYLFIDNYNNYTQARTSYKDKLNNIIATDPLPQYDAAQVKSLKDYYRRNLDLIALSGLGLYAFNIVDAVVDAHLYKFDISDNLSFKIKPLFIPSYNTGICYGVYLTLRIK